MNPGFRLYFKTMDLLDFIEPELHQIPEFFEFLDISVGIPRVHSPNSVDPVIGDSTDSCVIGDVYISDDDSLDCEAVVDAHLRVSVDVRPGCDIDVAVMDIWRALLRAIDLPADSMADLLPDWATPLERVMWALWPWVFGSHDVPFWHRRFYRWLTTRADMEWFVNESAR